MDKKTRLLSIGVLSPLLLTACCITDFLFAGNLNRGSTVPGASTSPRPVTTGSIRPTNPGSASNPASTAPGNTSPPSGAVASRAPIPLPQFSVSPVPIGIPVPVPMIIPVGIPLPVPDIRPTPVSQSPPGTSGAVTAPTGGAAPATRLFEIESVTVVRQPDLRYRFEVKGQGFALLEAYAFLQARLGPFVITLIENGRYRSEDSSLTELAIGDQEMRFVWQPAQGGPTASDRFNLSFQPLGVEQVFQTAEMEMILTSE
jgi:hypothetical protein